MSPLDLTLPNSLYGVPVAVTDINSSFSGVRFQASCPSNPASFTMSVNSYRDSTPTAASTPLPVTGCGARPYNPQYSLTAAKGAHDKAVAITTTITQTPAESPNGPGGGARGIPAPPGDHYERPGQLEDA
jgi:hypothetical protein